MSQAQILQPPSLHEENLIPLYLIEDKLKENFKNTNSFILNTRNNFSVMGSQISNISSEQNQMKVNFDTKMKQMEKKIVQEISLELEGRIAIAIGKSIQSFTEKLDKKQQQMGDFKQEFSKKMDKTKQDLKYEMAQENQKLIIKETKKMQESLKSLQKKLSSQIGSVKKTPINVSAPPPQEQGDEAGGSENWQQQHEFMKVLEGRIQKLQEFSVNVDKRFYNGMTSLKDSWKQLGTQLLENKKALNKKMDDLRMQFIKLKNLKQFSFAPDKVQEEFQRKLAQKFTDIYQLLSKTLTKNEYQSSSDRLNNRVNRHDDEMMEIRNELASNSEFFTFYANNADQDDLKQSIQDLKMIIQNNREYGQTKDNELKQQNNKNHQEVLKLGSKINKITIELEDKIKTIDRVNEVVSLVEGRIENLEDFNKFGPDKLQTIHNALDAQFTATEKQLIDKKEKNTGMKDMKIELGKMKDQMFILSSQYQIKDEELSQMKKMYHQLQAKIDKMKGDTEEAMIVRKPWVCLSCDKQEKEKEHQKKESKMKKGEPFKGFGTQRSSQKTLKAPPAQQRFQVYEKFRQKYLSDAVRLPDIVRDKLKDKQSSFHS